jgi:rod shape-determining protein MreD
MTPRRVIAAAAAILTVLVLQATVLGPLTAPWVISLPAVFVAAVGIEAGASAGMSIGFSAGLLADLGSQHPAGVLAIAWLLLGTISGLFAGPRRRVRGAIAVVALASAVTSLLVAVALDLIGSPPSSLASDVLHTGPTFIGDVILAGLVVLPMRAVLRALRVPALPPPLPHSRAIAADVTAAGRVAIDA